MIRAAATLALALCLLACALVAGCAAPGDPTARHPVIPVAVTDLAAQQYGKAFALTFTLPIRSTDREALPERPALEIYRAALSSGETPDKKTAFRLAFMIPSGQLDSYLRGTRIEFFDPLTAEDLARPAGSSVAYKVRTRANKARASQDSNVVAARIYPAPEAPRDVRVAVMESAVIVSWTEPPLPPDAAPHNYRIYRSEIEPGQASPPPDVASVKLKAHLEMIGNSGSNEYRDAHFEFGATYLYTVRNAAQYGEAFAESADSAPATVTPRDVFPPAAPAGLEIGIVPATAQAPAYVELSWAISPEGDLAGYSVYRSDAENSPGDRLSTEILPSPTFRDISVRPGRRYYYRISALDRAGNESPKSPAAAADVP